MNVDSFMLGWKPTHLQMQKEFFMKIKMENENLE